MTIKAASWLLNLQSRTWGWGHQLIFWFIQTEVLIQASPSTRGGYLLTQSPTTVMFDWERTYSFKVNPTVFAYVTLKITHQTSIIHISQLTIPGILYTAVCDTGSSRIGRFVCWTAINSQVSLPSEISTKLNFSWSSARAITMSRLNEMAKRSSGARSSTDYVPIPEETGLIGTSRRPWSCLQITVLIAMSIAAVLAATVAGILSVNVVRPVRAGCVVTTYFSNPCSAVHSEMVKRVRGQYDIWHDPHNNGTYSFDGTQIRNELSLTRLSGSASAVKYTDAVHMVLTPSTDGASCTMESTSDSQVFSILDFATNFCNINNLYCSDELCHPFEFLTYTYKVGKCSDSNIRSCYTV